MYLVINKCVKAVKVSNFTCHYLRNRSTLDIGVLGYIGIVQHKEHSPEVFHIPPGTPCINSTNIPPIMIINRIYFSVGGISPYWALAFILIQEGLFFLDHTHRYTTVCRTPLDEWSARRRDLYLTTHNTHNRHPCPRWYSNPRSQQASGCIPTP